MKLTERVDVKPKPIGNELSSLGDSKPLFDLESSGWLRRTLVPIRLLSRALLNYQLLKVKTYR